MSVATTLSRVTGFARMWATGLALGVTALASSYNVANNVPNMIFELVAGGILSALFIPTYLEVKAQRGEDDAWRFASHVFNLAVLSLGVIAAIGTIWPEPFIWTQTFRASGADAEAVRRTSEYFFRFFAIQVVIYGGGMVIQGVLNAQRRYLWVALGPVFNNLVVIATMFAYYYLVVVAGRPETALAVLAAGTTLGVVTMFAVMVPDLIRGGVRYSFELGLGDKAVRGMLLLAVPTVVYVVTNIVAVSFRNASAFAVSPDGPSVLMYAWTFFQLPYGILAVALATAVFTELSDAAGRKDITAFKDHFRRGFRTTGVLMLPAAAMLIALAEPLISLYRVGRFDAAAVPTVAGALRLWGAGLVFYACMMFVLRTFYSLKDTRTPMLANLALTPVQIGLYIILSTGVLQWPGIGIYGMPLADGIFYLLLLATLAMLLRRRIGGYDMSGVTKTFMLMALASAIGGLAAYAVSIPLAPETPGLLGGLRQVVVSGTIGVAIAFLAGRMFGVPEVAEGWALVRRLVQRRTGRDG